MSGLASKKPCEDDIYHFIIFRAWFGKNERHLFYAAQHQFHKIRLAQPQNVPEMSGLASKKLCEDDIYHFIIFRA